MISALQEMTGNFDQQPFFQFTMKTGKSSLCDSTRVILKQKNQETLNQM